MHPFMRAPAPKLGLMCSAARWKSTRRAAEDAGNLCVAAEWLASRGRVGGRVRNHGFLHEGRKLWRLSPAFDINPSPERVRELKTWISEEAGPEMSIDALMSVIAYFRITRARAKNILSQVEHAVAGWRGVGRGVGMTNNELEPFADAFEHSERTVVKKMLRFLWQTVPLIGSTGLISLMNW